LTLVGPHGGPSFGKISVRGVDHAEVKEEVTSDENGRSGWDVRIALIYAWSDFGMIIRNLP